MVNEILRRVPIGINDTFALYRLNEGFRWIDQNGPTVWRLTYSSLAMNGGTAFVNLPADFDPSKPAWFSGGASWRMPIPFMPWEKFLALQTTGGSPMGAAVGMFSAWSWAANNGAAPASYSYTAYFFPDSGKPSVNLVLPFVYHRLTPAPLAVSNTAFYPTPDAYDDVIVDLAEAEVKRIYNQVGWAEAQKRAEAGLARLASGTRSTKEVAVELMEQAKQTQERQLSRQG